MPRILGNVQFLNGLQPAFDLTYDDVFMVPSRSSVGSRTGVSRVEIALGRQVKDWSAPKLRPVAALFPVGERPAAEQPVSSIAVATTALTAATMQRPSPRRAVV